MTASDIRPGDAMLFETGDMIKKHCRKDTVIARIGGDEFCILSS